MRMNLDFDVDGDPNEVLGYDPAPVTLTDQMLCDVRAAIDATYAEHAHIHLTDITIERSR